MGINGAIGMNVKRFRQRLVELVAAELHGATPALVANWRTHGSVPYRRRMAMIEQARAAGIVLREEDFEDWKRLNVQ
jgi:hypothetical protein